MLQYYKENIQLYILFLVSIVVGIVGGNVVFSIFLTLTIILMKSKRLYEELFYGFFFVLLISDSLEESLVFAKNGKNIYILLLSLFILADRKVLPTLNTLYQIFIPFFIFSFFTALLSLNEPFFITSIQKTVSYFLVFFVVPNLINKLYLEKGAAFFRDFIFFAFTILIIGFILKYVSYDLSHIKGGRYRGVFGNPNGLGVYCVLMFIIFYVLNDFFPT